jgi:polar amino acid transport system permease protein
VQELIDLYGPRFLSGAIVTLQVTIVGVAIGVAIGLLLALARLYGPRAVATAVGGYIEVFRGTPLLVQVFIIYYGLPAYGISLDGMIAAFVALGMNSGAYQAEYFRGAIRSIDPGQAIAARSIGMTQLQALRYVVLPQAARVVLPAWSNEVIGVMKASAVVFIIAVPDLMGQAKIIFGRTFNPIEAYAIVSVVYLVMIAIGVFLLSRVERRLRIPGLELAHSGR